MTRKTFNAAVVLLGVCVVMCGGCGRRETLIEVANREGQFRVGNGGEPGDLDPQIDIGQIEHDVMLALYEGLVYADAKDSSPRPGVAESWDISTNGLVYTFHLRKNARWSNGDPVTARDFYESYRRILTPALAAQYSYMLYPVTNAEAFNNGTISNFDQVGIKALDDYTLQLQLHSPTPYLLQMMVHDSWYPVPISTIKKHGAIDDRGNPWTRPEFWVGNGPFVLKEWRLNSHIIVEKNTNYWGADKVKLKSIFFNAEANYDTEERMFRSGQLHTIRTAPQSKIDFYRQHKPDLIKIYPILTTYYYYLNVNKPPLNDKRVRRALALSIDRKAIVDTITRAGDVPAYTLTPPGTAGFVPQARWKEDIAEAKRLLAEAGFPDGKDFPKMTLLYNTLQSHKAIAEAAQEMWDKNLNIHVELVNQEWKVYLDAMRNKDFEIGRGSWGADYVDPSTFMDLFVSTSGNNESGWTNVDYDHFSAIATGTGDQAARYAAYQKCEDILADEMPIIPFYVYATPRLIQPCVKGWYPNLLDSPDYRSIYLEAGNK